jgi:hypothetical protein
MHHSSIDVHMHPTTRGLFVQVELMTSSLILKQSPQFHALECLSVSKESVHQMYSVLSLLLPSPQLVSNHKLVTAVILSQLITCRINYWNSCTEHLATGKICNLLCTVPFQWTHHSNRSYCWNNQMLCF